MQRLCYPNLPDATENQKCPDEPCIWHMDLDSGAIKPILKYIDFAKFESMSEIKDVVHKVNHNILNTS